MFALTNTLIIAFVGLAASFGPTVDPKSAHTKPNIVFALIDDLGWSNTEFGGSGGEVGAQNTEYNGIKTTADYGLMKTPVMKSLESESIKLNQHYAYAWCAPSRSSLISGRIPVHVNVEHANPIGYNPTHPESSGEGIPAGMKTVGTMLQEAGYKTHYNGKWGVGYTWKKQNPASRGYDSHLVFLHDSADFWDLTMRRESIEVPGGCEKLWRNTTLFPCAKCTAAPEGEKCDCEPKLPFDLIKNGEPAYELVGTKWVDYLFLEESLKNIAEHDTAAPFFLIHSFHAIHAPLNAPTALYEQDDAYMPPPCTRDGWDGGAATDPMRECFGPFFDVLAAAKAVAGVDSRSRRSYASYVTWVDNAIGQIIDGLKARAMYDNTLMVVSSDNGGPQYLSPQGYQKWGSGNNLPLRGGKSSEFNGGIRVNSFVTGGLVPRNLRGTHSDGLIQFADWYMTFCKLSGHPNCEHDEMAELYGLPQPDGFDQWPFLTGKTTSMPRTEVTISVVTHIEWPYKMMLGADPNSINQHTVEGFVPLPNYATGYLTGWPTKADSPPGAVVAVWEGFCGSIPTAAERVLTEFLEVLSGNNPEYYGGMKEKHEAGEICTAGYDCTEGCLFNIEEDPNETTNLASDPAYAATHMRLKNKLETEAGHKWTAKEPWGIFLPSRNTCAPGQFDEKCSDFKACQGFLETGSYNYVVEEGKENL